MMTLSSVPRLGPGLTPPAQMDVLDHNPEDMAVYVAALAEPATAKKGHKRAIFEQLSNRFFHNNVC